jgi:endoglucanase
MTRTQQQRLLQLLALPTAPFRETHVAAFVRTLLARHKIPFLSDPAGNLILGCRSPQEYRRIVASRSTEPVRVFIAHMDHPGFHGIRWLTPTRLSVRWHGGSPVRHLAGSRVWLADDTGYLAHGRLKKTSLHRHGHSINRAEVRLDRPISINPPAGDLFGGFAFRAPVWQQGRRLYTKAADDLVGVHTILETAIRHFSNPAAQRRTPFLGLLTRGEEVGFIGALAHFELGWLDKARRPVMCVSLETSRTLPGAIVGKGPVVRLGDRRTVFDAGGLRVLSELAEKVLPKRHQRRIMDGGTCEATAATAYGLPAIGISVPLGNYHNEGYEGGPDSHGPRGPTPEYVHLDDIIGMMKLCEALMQPGLPWENPWHTVRRKMKLNLRTYRKLLKRGI